MQIREAVALLAPAELDRRAPAIWADLGCGAGLFTRALADLLSPGSTIHAVDRDAAALARLPSARNGVRMAAHHGDFVDLASGPWPFEMLDGVLMANSLHYVEQPLPFIQSLIARMKARHRFLIVEYDMSRPSRWVPYPLDRAALTSLFAEAGYQDTELLAIRPSIYQRAGLYAAQITRSF
jgi:SAM-dependent methyltransferase